MPIRGTLNRKSAALLVTVVLALVAGVVTTVLVTRGDSSSRATGDPAPALTGEPVPVGPAGATERFGDATVTVPPGAVPAGGEITLSAAEVESGTLRGERLGPPVHVDLGKVELGKAIEVTWDLAALPDDIAAVAVPVRWDAALGTWSAALPEGTSYDVEGDRLSLTSREFSFWDWIANTQQSVLEFAGTRVEAPTCQAGFKPPRWVRSVVRPDEDLNATALRTCLDPDKDEVITVRVANNRAFSQRLTHRDGGQEFAWRWYGESEPSLEWALYEVAAGTLDEDTPRRMLLPPLAQTSNGLARPTESGVHHVRLEGQVDLSTALTDVIIWAVGKSGVDRALVRGVGGKAMATLFECGKDLVGDRVTPVAVVKAAKSCVEDSRKNFATEMARLAKLGKTDPGVAKAHRKLSGLARKLQYLLVAEISFYLSDQLLQFAVGDAAMSFNLTGQPQQPGRWTATCTDVEKDSDLLYRNLAHSEPYLDDERDLVDVPGFRTDARAAIKPVARCGDDHAERLAGQVRGDWADQRSARVVIELLAAAHGFVADPLDHDALLGAPVPALCGHPAGTLVDGELPNRPEHSGGVYLGEELDIGDLDGDGADEAVAVIQCNAGGVGWPDSVHVYRPGPELVESLTLADFYDPEWEHREGVQSVEIGTGGRFSVTWFAHVPGDAMCCASQVVRGEFELGKPTRLVSLDVLSDSRFGPEWTHGAFPTPSDCKKGPRAERSVASAAHSLLCFGMSMSTYDDETRYLFEWSAAAVYDLDLGATWTYRSCREDDGSYLCLVDQAPPAGSSIGVTTVSVRLRPTEDGRMRVVGYS